MADLFVSTLIQGLIYALVSFGVYITYSILDFPDLGVDGTFPLGAAVTALLLIKGVDPWLTLVISLLVGALAGLFTGVVHVRLKVRDLLAGIITMTALFSVNLLIAGGANLPVERAVDTIFTAPSTMAVLGGLTLSGRKLVISLVLAVGLMISNALVALGGCLVCHETRSFSATMGTGQLVFGLAAVIIGVSLFRFYGATGLAQSLRRCRPLRFLGSPRDTTAVIVGSFLYKACIQIAMSLGLPTNMLKLVTAVLFLLVLVVSGRKGEEIIHA